MKFLRQMFSNDNGTASSNRVFLAVIVAALLSWANLIVVKTNVIPEVPSTWVYLVGVFSGVVAFTKGADAYKETKGANNESQTT